MPYRTGQKRLACPRVKPFPRVFAKGLHSSHKCLIRRKLAAALAKRRLHARGKGQGLRSSLQVSVVVAFQKAMNEA